MSKDRERSAGVKNTDGIDHRGQGNHRDRPFGLVCFFVLSVVAPFARNLGPKARWTCRANVAYGGLRPLGFEVRRVAAPVLEARIRPAVAGTCRLFVNW